MQIYGVLHTTNVDITLHSANGVRGLPGGVALLDDREIQQVINLYGSTERALCAIIGVYHCWYLQDEVVLLQQADDDDPFRDADIPEECLDLGIVLPSAWDDNQEGDTPPQCRINLPE